jgi:glycosyltransferase involved in cell wall biosynthesis
MIFYLQDLFPEVGLAMGRLKPGPVTSLLWWATQLGLRRANRVVVLGEDMRRRVLARDIRPHRIEVIPNWIDTETVKPPAPGQSLRREWDLDGQFLVMYSGNLGLSQDLGQILEAAQTLRHEPIVFLFVGDGAAKADLMEKAASLSLSNVRFLPYQARDRLAVSLGTADLHLIPMQPGLTGLLVPSKLYGILAVGKAYVASVDEDSDVGRVTREANSGILVPPGRPAQLAKAILWAVSNRDTLMEMGERGRAVAQALFDRRLAVAKFSRMLLSIRGEQQDALATPDGLADSSQRRSAAIAAAVSSYRVRVDAGATGVPRCVAPNFFAPASIEAALATPD